MIGTIRPIETTTIEKTGTDSTVLYEELLSATPAGFVMSLFRHAQAATTVTATATYTRENGAETIEAPGLDALHAKTPEGWQLLFVQA